MYSGNQNTILNEISFFGKPKNMERVVNITFLPADINSGIVFKRVDLKKNNIIKVDYDSSYIENDKLVLRNSSGATINNIDILLASIWASRIDNILIEIDGDSIPHVDGTAEPFLFLFTSARNKELEKSRRIFETEKDIGMRINNSEISIKPDKSFIINIKEDSNSFEFNNSILPFKDWLSKVSVDDVNQKLKSDIISTIAIIFLSGLYCTFEVNIINFDKNMVYNFFKNLFTNK